MKTTVLHKQLTRRYLLWAYKTTRESLERIERKTTQLKVDHYILDCLKVGQKPAGVQAQKYQKLMGEFKEYIAAKTKDELSQKYSNGKKETLNAHYLYLTNRLSAIEKAIKHFLGKSELKKFEILFEQEFTTRILQAREH